MSHHSNECFRATATMIAELVSKDYLRYTTDNIASLLTLFRLKNKNGQAHFISVIFHGELAESVSRDLNTNAWYLVDGDLNDKSPAFENYSLSNLSIRANAISAVSSASDNIIQCELLGRLTHDPEHLVKGKNFEFSRFSIAVNRVNAKRANFFNVSVFKPNLIKQVEDLLKKGNSVFLVGELAFFDKGDDKTVHANIKLERFIPFE